MQQEPPTLSGRLGSNSITQQAKNPPNIFIIAESVLHCQCIFVKSLYFYPLYNPFLWILYKFPYCFFLTLMVLYSQKG